MLASASGPQVLGPLVVCGPQVENRCPTQYVPKFAQTRSLFMLQSGASANHLLHLICFIQSTIVSHMLHPINCCVSYAASNQLLHPIYFIQSTAVSHMLHPINYCVSHASSNQLLHPICFSQ